MGRIGIRLSCFLCLFLGFSSLVVAQSGLDRQITFKTAEVPLAEALVVFEQESGLLLSYQDELLRNKSVGSVSESGTARSILQGLLSPHDLAYKVVGDQLVLFRSRKQSMKTINGYVRDAESGVYLMECTIYDVGNKSGATTNEAGYFSYAFPQEDSLLLRFSYIGYASQEYVISGLEHQELMIALVPEFAEVSVIVEDEASRFEVDGGVSRVSIPVTQMQLLPNLGGEADIAKVYQSMPGVQSGNEGTSGLFVRGGGNDQNLILLDGIPVYNPTHLFGFFSVFNVKAIKEAELIKAGFPARYSGRLSSVFDIHSKEGDFNDYHGHIGIGLLLAKAGFEGPIVEGKSSFSLEGRTSFLGAILQPVSRVKNKKLGIEGASDYGFYDANAKLFIKPNKRDQFSFSMFVSGDNYFDDAKNDVEYLSTLYERDEQNRIVWNNTVASAKWNRAVGQHTFSKLSLHYSSYSFGYSQQVVLEEKDSSILNNRRDYFLYQSDLVNMGYSWQYDYAPSNKFYLRAGLKGDFYRFEPGVNSFREFDVVNASAEIDSTFSIPKIPAFGQEFFVESDILIGDIFRLNLGVNTNLFSVENKTYISPQPRLSGAVQATDKFLWSFSVSRMTQNLHLITNSGIGLPTDLWVPSTAKIKPEGSWQFATGFNYQFENDVRFSVEGYFKEFSNLTRFQNNSGFLLQGEFWEDNTIIGTGMSYGGEMLLEKTKGKVRGWMALTIAKSERTFKDVNNGEPFPYKFDRRYDFNTTVIYDITPRFTLSGSWVYGTGNVITIPEAEAPVIDPVTGQILSTEFIFGPTNAFRLNPFHRLDLSFTARFSGKVGEHSLYLGVYNLYNRKNPFYGEYGADPDDPAKRAFREVSLIPVLPSASYQFEF